MAGGVSGPRQIQPFRMTRILKPVNSMLSPNIHSDVSTLQRLLQAIHPFSHILLFLKVNARSPLLSFTNPPVSILTILSEPPRKALINSVRELPRHPRRNSNITVIESIHPCDSGHPFEACHVKRHSPLLSLPVTHLMSARHRTVKSTTRA